MILTFKPAELKRLLGNAVLFACKDETLPFLCVVRFAFVGEYLHFVSTNRYVCSAELVDTVQVEGERVEFSLRASDAKAILRSIPRGMQDITLEHDPESGKVVVSYPDGSSASYASQTGDFTKWQILFKDAGNTERATVALNTEFLAPLAKVNTGSPSHHTARFTFSAGNKPVLVEMGATFKAVICVVNGAGA